MGVDAEVVAGVEAQREKGVKVTPMRYIRAATRADASPTPAASRG